jgi:hypothetical protein
LFPIAEGGPKIVWVFRLKNRDLRQKILFFPILGGGVPGAPPLPPPLDPPMTWMDDRLGIPGIIDICFSFLPPYCIRIIDI